MDGIERDIYSGFLFYVHFGTPGATWGPAGRLIKGTRTKIKLDGYGALRRELTGNGQGKGTARLCRALISVGGFLLH